jgi:hypothetical protein
MYSHESAYARLHPMNQSSVCVFSPHNKHSSGVPKGN